MVRTLKYEGWYFKGDSTHSGEHASKSPTYPAHHIPKSNVKL